MKRFGARGALSDPPQLGESVVVLAWEAEAAIAKVAEAAVVQILGSDEDTRDALTEAFRQGQRDMLAKCIAETQRQLFRKNGMLNFIGSSVDEGSSVEFCCPCDWNQRAAENLIAALRALKDRP